MRGALSGPSLLILLGTALVVPVSAVHEARAMDGLTIMKRDLCHSFKLDCRKQRSSASRRPAAKPKPPQQAAKPLKPAPAVPTHSVKPSPPAVAATPVPREKPAAAVAATPVEKPVAKPMAEAPAVPIPREKPAEPASARLPDKAPDKTPEKIPEKAADNTTAEAPPAAPAPAVPAAPIPRERPSLLPSLPPVASTVVAAPEPSAAAPAPEAKQPEPKIASIAPGATTATTGPSTCAQGLRAAKVEFDVVPASFGADTCPVADPVRLHAVETPSGTVTFPEGPVFNCRFARQFTQWVSDTGSAVVLAQTSKRLEKLATGPGYDCRHRNGDSSGKMSEHAAGDAVDITSMTLDGGTTIRMADAINPASPSFPVLRALRTTACGYFSTVLGPGANAAHKEHYHFDMGVHGKSGNYRICE